jgi:hypothetical protein
MSDYNNITLDLTAAFKDVLQPTPFGTYDADTNFQFTADGLVRQVYRRLGGDILQIELTNKDVYAGLEQATLEYSAIVNTYQAKSVLANVIGFNTGSLSGSQNQNPRMDLGLAKRVADGYSSEAQAGGSRTLYSASITLNQGQQYYDLKTILSTSGIIPDGQKAEIRDIFHFDPVAAYRFFDTTSAINYLNNQFQFESFTPETIFYMLPVWEDMLRAQQLEVNQKVRRSNYSYGLVGNILSVYPTPACDGFPLFFTYYLIGASDGYDETDPFTTGVSNLSNVPFR